MSDARQLDGLEITSGVSASTGEGFLIVEAVLSDGARAAGQMSPAEVRMTALGWLAAAEAAESDAMVHAEMKEAGLPNKTADGFIRALRTRRAKDFGGAT